MNHDKSVNLNTWELATMQLEKLGLNDETLVATGNGMRLILPVELEKTLQPLVGLKIRILHTDIPAKEYIIRVMSEKPDEQAIVAEANYARNCQSNTSLTSSYLRVERPVSPVMTNAEGGVGQ